MGVLVALGRDGDVLKCYIQVALFPAASPADRIARPFHMLKRPSCMLQIYLRYAFL